MPQSLRERENLRIAGFTLMGILLGLIGALTAFVLYRLILLVTNIFFFQRFSFAVVYPSQSQVGLWVIVIPAIGGLIVGAMVKWGSDRIRGHGIPEAMEAVLLNKSIVRPRVAILKPLSAAIAVGTGGPFGAEGPIIQTGGAIGSLIGQALNMTASERKILLGCGAAAGMVGIFNTPITAVVLVLELLLFEFRPRSLLPVIIASAVAAGARHYLIGGSLMFAVTPSSFGSPPTLILFALLGILIGLIAWAFTNGLFLVERLFDRLGKYGLNMLLAPAVGGLVLGVIAYFEPRVLGMGYNTIGDILHGNITGAGELTRLAVAKSAALWVSLGSGTSGGLLAPMLLVGASIGSLFGNAVHAISPASSFNTQVAAIVGMSALFASAARAPFTATVFAFELTGNYEAILPLMVAGVTADVVARLLLTNSIMTERLYHRGLRVPQAYVADPLSGIAVGNVMTADVDTIPGDMPVREAVALMQRGGTRLSRHQGFPVIDPDGHLSGVVTRGDLSRLVTAEQGVADAELDGPVSQVASTDLAVTQPDEMLAEALLTMVQRGVGRLPVVARGDPRTLVGWLSRSDIFRARARAAEEETVRERRLRIRRVRRTQPSAAVDGKQPARTEETAGRPR
jgi:H+/Cl- antiporter ClcA